MFTLRHSLQAAPVSRDPGDRSAVPTPPRPYKLQPLEPSSISRRRPPGRRSRILQSPLLELGLELRHEGSIEKLFDAIDFIALAVEPYKDGLFVVVRSEGGVSVCDGVDYGCVVGGVVDGVVDGELLVLAKVSEEVLTVLFVGV